MLWPSLSTFRQADRHYRIGVARLSAHCLCAAGPPTKANRIVEVAALEHESGAVMSLLVNIAPMQMPEAAQNVHGISTAMVHDPEVPDFRYAVHAVAMRICSAVPAASKGLLILIRLHLSITATFQSLQPISHCNPALHRNKASCSPAAWWASSSLTSWRAPQLAARRSWWRTMVRLCTCWLSSFMPRWSVPDPQDDRGIQQMLHGT